MRFAPCLNLIALSSAILSAVAFDGCEFPKFEWAVASTTTGGSFTVRKLAVVDSNVVAFGSATLEDGAAQTLKGPFTAEDPTASSGTETEKVMMDGGGTQCAFSFLNKNDGTPVKSEFVDGTGECEVYAVSSRSYTTVAGLSIKGTLSTGTGICADASYDTYSVVCTENQERVTTVNSTIYNAVLISFDAKFNPDWLAFPFANPDVIYSYTTVYGTAVDSSGGVYAAGVVNTSPVGRRPGNSGMLAKLSEYDGSVVWQKAFPEATFLVNVVYDENEHVLFVTAFLKSNTEDVFACTNDDGCTALMRISADDGSVHWLRYTPGWMRGPKDKGEVHLAHPDDGPYVYAFYHYGGAYGTVSLDAGTSYAGCEDANGNITLEYEEPFDMNTEKLTQEDCDEEGLGTYFGPETNMAPANETSSEAYCPKWYHCLVKYHKVTGLPVWGSLLTTQVTAFVPQADKIIFVGPVYNSMAYVGDVKVPTGVSLLEGYDVSIQGAVSTEDGAGLYVQPIIADRAWAGYPALVQDDDEVTYLSFVTTSNVTSMGNAPAGFDVVRGDVCGPEQDLCMGAQSLVVAKLGTFPESETMMPNCLTACSDTGKPTIKEGMCYIDQMCYNDGDDAAHIGMPCLQCNAAESQEYWKEYNLLSDSFCLIDKVCKRKGQFAGTSRSESQCQFCDPLMDNTAFSVKEGYKVNKTAVIPDECSMIEDEDEHGDEHGDEHDHGDGKGDDKGDGKGDDKGDGKGDDKGDGKGDGKDGGSSAATFSSAAFFGWLTILLSGILL